MQRRFDEILKHDRILLAVSGGVDSMCMASLFLNSSHATQFALAHCNFNLRGEESDADEALVRKWAKDNNVEVHVRAFDTKAHAVANGISIEMAARELRYEWFADLCTKNAFTAVAVAHNANDNVETLFLNLIRGTGIRGLSGMQYASKVPAKGSDIDLIRPLLDFTRNQIEGYAFKNKLPYRNDRTNFENEYKRNKLRNVVFPIFEQMNPSFIKTVGREMGYFSQIEDLVEDVFLKAKLACFKENEGAGVISIPSLMTNSQWSYFLYRLLEGYNFNSSTVASLEDLLSSEKTISGKRFESPTHQLITTTDTLFISEIKLDASDPIMVIRTEGKYSFNGRSFSVDVRDGEIIGSPIMPKGVIAMDFDAMDFPLVARRWREGDWMAPLGMGGRKKKVSDIFTNAKYSLLDKEAAIVIVRPDNGPCGQNSEQGSRVLAIMGQRIDESVKIGPNTKKVIVFSEL